MNYKYKKNQIFGKRLKVPRGVMIRVYNSSLSFEDYIKYELEGKVPTSVIAEEDKELVEKFGLERCKSFDWELIRRNDLSSKYLEVDPSVEDINIEIYESIKNNISLSNYSSRMKEYYKDRFFEMPKNELFSYDEEESIKRRFNYGSLSTREVIEYWELLKDKDVSYVLLNDGNVEQKITKEQIIEFMDRYSTLRRYIGSSKIYNIIICSEDKRDELIKSYLDEIIKDEYRILDNDFYKMYFSYSSLEDYLVKVDSYDGKKLIEELKGLPKDYIFDCGIPFRYYNYHVISFVGRFGLKNVVDFDNECGHFFTNNDCLYLKLMYAMFINYAGNEHDPKKNIFAPNYMNGEEHTFTKDEFYESMKRMIVNGPSNWDYFDKAPNYMSMMGEFRTRNKDLFLDEDAPDDLKELFYTKKITPEFMAEHPEYKEYLRGRSLSNCFEHRELELADASSYYERYVMMYDFFVDRFGFDTAMDLIIEYGSIIETVSIAKWKYSLNVENYLTRDCTLEEVKELYVKQFMLAIININNLDIPYNIPDEVRDNNSRYFVSSKAPLELKIKVSKKDITSKDLEEHPEYIDYIKDMDLRVLFKNYPVNIKNKNGYYEKDSIVSMIQEKYGNESSDIVCKYIDYIEMIYDDSFIIEEGFDILDYLDDKIYQNIIDGNIKYNDQMYLGFKNKHKDLFLDDSVDIEFKNKFYNRELTINDLQDNSMLEKVGNTNIACGLGLDCSWMINTFKNETNGMKANLNRILLLGEYIKIQDYVLKAAFREFVCSLEDIEIDKIKYAVKVLEELSLSNSYEIYTMRKELAVEILKSNNPLSVLRKIEEVFIKNNLPTIGKIYSTFQILHPDLKDFDFKSEKMCPSLMRKSLMSKKILLFSDLIKASFGSNNKSVRDYLYVIKAGNVILENIKKGKVKFEELDEESIKILDKFRHYLCTLFNNSLRGKGENNCYTLTDDILGDIYTLAKKVSIDESIDYDIGDRMVKMFCFYSGINTVDDALFYLRDKVVKADKRNRDASKMDMVLEKGDFVKGIIDIIYLGKILQNGSVSKEFLGPGVSSDYTPLDTDVSMILGEGDNSTKLGNVNASRYGPIWFVLKHDDRFCMTRKHNGSEPDKYDKTKIECFYTGYLGSDHYGIRTGFASSEINYIMVRDYDPRIGLEIAINGFYIPVCNVDGKILFTAEDYDKLRSQMRGLSYYDTDKYQLSDNLGGEMVNQVKEELSSTLEDNVNNLNYVYGLITKSLNSYGIPRVNNGFSGDLSSGLAEVYSTGSTARNAFVPGDKDYDYVIKVDRKDFTHIENVKESFKNVMSLVDHPSGKLVGTIKNPKGEELEVEISFQCKTDKNDYSTNASLDDYYESIKKMYPDNYLDVLANVVLAKKVFKEANVYKSAKSDSNQGGLGGIGIENWILQHGGSFKDAATDFMKVSMECNYDFDKFKEVYQVWDFGNNHYEGGFPHDNFVYQDNKKMTKSGYEKMIRVLANYLKIDLVNEEEKGINL